MAAMERVRCAIEANEGAGRRKLPMVRVETLSLSEEVVRAVAGAKEIANAAGRRTVAPRDLAAAILREENTLAARLLREYTPDQT